MKTFTSLKSVGSIACIATALVCGSASAVTTQIYQESFEDDSNLDGLSGLSPTAADRGYSAGTEFNDLVDLGGGSYSDGKDFWYRADTTIANFNPGGDNHIVNTESIHGDAFWSAQDLDGEGGLAERTLTISGIDISGHTSLAFSFLAAAGEAFDGFPVFESDNFLKVEYKIDGGSTNTLIDFRTVGGAVDNADLSPDTDLNGSGDGTALTTNFQTYNASIAGTGSTLDLIFTVNTDGTREEIAFDNIVVTADVVPEPSSTALLGLASLGLLARRKR